MTKSILQPFESSFEAMKKELGFKSTIEDIDRIFFVRDAFHKGVLPHTLSRAICSQMVKTYHSWLGKIHGLIVPNPGSMMDVAESSIFNDADKERLSGIMKEVMAHITENSIVGLTKDKKREAKFIDRSVELWDENLPVLIDFSTRINEYWKEASKKHPEQI